MCPFKEIVGGEVVNRDRNHESSRDVAALERFIPKFVVGEQRFLDISACAEELAGGCEGLGDLRDDPRGAENRQLRAERGEQVAAMTLSPMIGMNGDPVNE